MYDMKEDLKLHVFRLFGYGGSVLTLAKVVPIYIYIDRSKMDSTHTEWS